MKATNMPAVDVTIGGQTRIYHAFVTTAPATFDAPSTLTLYESSFADVAGFAADVVPFERALGRAPARLVLIGTTELVWQRPFSRRKLPARVHVSDSRRAEHSAELPVAPAGWALAGEVH